MLRHWRIAVVAGLIALPVVVLVALGSLHLWQQPHGIMAWWCLTVAVMMGCLLARWWQRSRRLVPPLDFTPDMHWTARDREAWKIVAAKAQAVGEAEAARVGELTYYVDLGTTMALELARFYHPNAGDPVGKLTIPEILAVIELAAHDLAVMVERYLPAGHLLTIDHWRQAHAASGWYRAGTNLYWAVSALFSPVNTGMRFLATRYGISKPWQALQQDLTLWFVTAYIHRLGTYLIDVYSGRLRVGAERYRELRDAIDRPAADPGLPQQITLAIVGQVKVGKSSLVNALVGQSQARVDVLPATDHVTRYERRGPRLHLSLLDTVGYGHEGPSADQLKATEQACRDADVIILVLHATNPARRADVDLLRRLSEWFAEQPQLVMPPVLAVMTHIDLLSPALEWQPNYHWIQPSRPKENSMAAARQAALDVFANQVADVIPCCTAANRLHGLDEHVLPALLRLLPEAKVAALHRLIKSEAESGQTRKVLGQLFEAGKGTMQALWELTNR